MNVEKELISPIPARVMSSRSFVFLSKYGPKVLSIKNSWFQPYAPETRCALHCQKSIGKWAIGHRN